MSFDDRARIINSPHGRYSVKKILKMNIYDRHTCKILGLPLNIKFDEATLKSNKWFGKFGKVTHIRIKSSPMEKDKKLKSQRAKISFASESSALMAINYCNENKFLFDDNRVLKATFEDNKYCEIFLLNMDCNRADCRRIHSWCNHKDILSKNDMRNFNRMPYGICNKQMNINNQYQCKLLSNNEYKHEGVETMIVRTTLQCINAMNRLTNEYSPSVVGFDLEWHRYKNKVSLLQIAFSNKLIILVRLHLLETIPAELISFLTDSKIFKCGVGIYKDKKMLMRDYHIKLCGCVELNDIFVYHKKQGCSDYYKNYGLEKMYKLLFNKDMKYKHAINHSKWECIKLTQKQIDYAANDAVVGYELFMKMFNASPKKDVFQFCFGIVDHSGDKYGKTIIDLTNHKNLQAAIKMSKIEQPNKTTNNNNKPNENSNNSNINQQKNENNSENTNNKNDTKLSKFKNDLLNSLKQRHQQIKQIEDEIENIKEKQKEIQLKKEQFEKEQFKKEQFKNAILENNNNVKDIDYENMNNNIKNDNENESESDIEQIINNTCTLNNEDEEKKKKEMDRKTNQLNNKLNEEYQMRTELIQSLKSMDIMKECDDLIKNKIETIIGKNAIKNLMNEIQTIIENGNDNEFDLNIEIEKKLKFELNIFENENKSIMQIIQQVLDERKIKKHMQKQKLIKKQGKNNESKEDKLIDNILNDNNLFITENENKEIELGKDNNNNINEDKMNTNRNKNKSKPKSSIYKLITTVNKNKNNNKKIISAVKLHVIKENKSEIQEANFVNNQADLNINMDHKNKLEYEIKILNKKNNQMQHLLLTKDKKEVNKVIDDLLRRNYNVNTHANYIHNENDELNQIELKRKQEIEDDKFISNSLQLVINQIKRSESAVNEVIKNILLIAFREANEDKMNEKINIQDISVKTNFERKSRIIKLEFLNDQIRRKIQISMNKIIKRKNNLSKWNLRVHLNKHQLQERKFKQEEDRRLNDQINDEYKEYNKKTIDNLFKRVDEGEKLNEQNIRKINAHLKNDIKESEILKRNLNNMNLNNNNNNKKDLNVICDEERERYDYDEYDYEYYNRREQIQNDERNFNRRGTQTIKPRCQKYNYKRYKQYNNNHNYQKQRHYNVHNGDRKYYNNYNDRNYEIYNDYDAYNEYNMNENDEYYGDNYNSSYDNNNNNNNNYNNYQRNYNGERN